MAESKQPPKPVRKVEKRQVVGKKGTAWHSVTPTRFITPNPHTKGPLAGGTVESH
jgi:hypothetical protein